MFTAYNYSPTDFFYNSTLNKYLTVGTNLYEGHKKKVQECLSTYISPDGVLNGSALRENWFSIDDTDVFISHSHKDIHKVKAFAGWLNERFGLTAFIDSCAWGYCDDLLHKIDTRYCYQKDKGTYDYNLRNYTTSHVHMMLSTALTETMNRSECVIFFNTPNSITMSNELSLINRNSKEKTTSPWIFYELTMITKIKRNVPKRRDSFLEHQVFDTRDKLTVEYDVSKIINDIPVLKEDDLKKWDIEWKNYKHPLDELYRTTGLI